MTDEDLLIQCDSALSLILHRESRGLSEQTKQDLDALIRLLRPRTDAITKQRRDDRQQLQKFTTCDNDCKQRAQCPDAGKVGHSQCGMCHDHKVPRHHCGCIDVRGF